MLWSENESAEVPAEPLLSEGPELWLRGRLQHNAQCWDVWASGSAAFLFFFEETFLSVCCFVAKFEQKLQLVLSLVNECEWEQLLRHIQAMSWTLHPLVQSGFGSGLIYPSIHLSPYRLCTCVSSRIHNVGQRQEIQPGHSRLTAFSLTPKPRGHLE